MKKLFFACSIFALLNIGSIAYAFELNGFGDVTYTKGTSGERDKGDFAVGAFDFYLTHPIDERTDVFMESVIEFNEEGEPVLDLERFQIAYLVNDALKLTAGRFHTILGYWNTSFHHGNQLQTSVERPAFLEFEDDGGILPVHLAGLWASGRYRTDNAAFAYGVMLGNGGKIKDGALDPNTASDDSGDKAVAFRLLAEPNIIPGLGVGLSGNYARVNGFTGPVKTTQVKQGILAIDVTYSGNNVEFISEYYLIKDKDDLVGSKDYSSNAFYAQGGYVFQEKFIPYIRYENVSLDNDGDPYFAALGTKESNRLIGGVRYNVSVMNSLKAEARSIDTKGEKKFEEYALQWAVAF